MGGSAVVALLVSPLYPVSVSWCLGCRRARRGTTWAPELLDLEIQDVDETHPIPRAADRPRISSGRRGQRHASWPDYDDASWRTSPAALEPA
jgi:hypothetical protein